MATYEVTAPDGRQLEIEGDTPPTEKDLDKIFNDLPQDNEPILDNIQVNDDGSLKPNLQGSITKSRRVDLRPSAIGDSIAKHIAAIPIAAVNAIKNKSFKGAYQSALDDIDKTQADLYSKYPFLEKQNNFDTKAQDIVTTLLLPETKLFKSAGLGARLGNSALTNAYQGGLIGGVEGLRDNGLKGFGQGALTGSLVGGALGAGLPLAGAAAGKILPRAGASAAGVTTDTIKQAIKPNSRALDLNADQAQALLYDTTNNVRNAYNNLLEQRGQAVNNAVKNINNNERIPIQDLQNDVTNIFDSYNGDRINPARNMTGNLERQLNDLIEQGAPTEQEIGNYINQTQKPQVFNAQKEAEAYDILSRATGKPKNWLKSQLNSDNWTGATGKRKEFINELLDKTDDKLDSFTAQRTAPDSRFSNYDYYDDSYIQDVGDSEKLARQAYDDIINRNFYNDVKDPLTQEINRADESYKYILNNVYKNSRKENIFEDSFKELEKSVKNLPEDIQAEYFNKFTNDAEHILDVRNNISPLDLQKAKQQVGKMVNWSDEAARNYQNPILERLYGRFNSRLSDISPELAQANADYAAVRNFQKNEGLKRILRPGDNIDSASSALKNYNSTVTKGNTGRNVQDLENILVQNGASPFLNTVNDINAAMDLNKSISTGRNFGGVTDLVKGLLVEPSLRGLRAFNRSPIPAVYNALKQVSPSVVQLLYTAGRIPQEED